MVTPHSDADKIKQLYDNPASVSTVENDIWTPYVSTKGVTAGTSYIFDIRVKNQG